MTDGGQRGPRVASTTSTRSYVRSTGLVAVGLDGNSCVALQSWELGGWEQLWNSLVLIDVYEPKKNDDPRAQTMLGLFRVALWCSVVANQQ